MATRILVVDDATFIRDMVKKQLRDKIPDSEIFDAADGNRALALLKTQRVDLILSDWEMPGMTGEEFLRIIRGHDNFKDTPFIMVSSRGDRDHVVKAIESGASDYLTKPFSADELLAKVSKQLKKINKDPGTNSGRKGQTQGMAFASVDVLTGTDNEVNRMTRGPGKPKPPPANTAPAAKKSAPGAAAAKPASTKAKGKAQLRFPKFTGTCVIRELTLKSMNCLMQRGDNMPTVFEQAVVDIEADDGENVARLNGYVHSIQAAEERMDSNIVKVTIRFVDNDPDKFEFLSKYIAKF